MAVSLPPTDGTVQPEYAAVMIGFNRSVKTAENGTIVAVFTANMSYQRTDYLLNAEGNKVGILSSDIGVSQQDSTRYGNMYLDAEKTAALFSTIPTPGVPLGEAIADIADSYIHEDLVARGIISA